MGIFKNMAVSNKGLRYKLMLAFSLMSIIPLLAFVYIVSIFLFPQLESLTHVSTIVMASIAISLLGLVLAKGLIMPVIEMALEAKVIAEGAYDRSIPVTSDDEVGHIASSINSMTQKIRMNLEELKSYGQRMRDINVEIHKKVIALSSLLQIGDVISTGSFQLDSLLEQIVEKAAGALDSGSGVLYMPRVAGGDFIAKCSYNIGEGGLDEVAIKSGSDSFFAKIMITRSVFVLDKSVKPNKEIEKLKADYGVANMIAVPITSGRRDLALLVVTNSQEDYKFKSDDVDLIKVFAKQATIAIESDILTKKTEELAIKDDLTDLFNKNFISGRLEEEIRRAVFYQRPCSFIIFGIDDFNLFRDKYGELAAEEALKRMARLIKDNITPVGKAARISGEEFAMLLPEKNKKEAAFLADEVRKKIEATNLLKDGKAFLTVSCGVGENPLDGATGDEIFKKAAELVKQARQSGKNKVAA